MGHFYRWSVAIGKAKAGQRRTWRRWQRKWRKKRLQRQFHPRWRLPHPPCRISTRHWTSPSPSPRPRGPRRPPRRPEAIHTRPGPEVAASRSNRSPRQRQSSFRLAYRCHGIISRPFLTRGCRHASATSPRQVSKALLICRSRVVFRNRS